MKKQAFTYIIIGAMLATGTLCGGAFADMDNKPSMVDRQEQMEMKHEKRLEMMADLLDLTETQQEQIRTIHEQERSGHEGLRHQMHDSHEQMRTLLDSVTFDESAIRNLATSQASLKTTRCGTDSKTTNTKACCKITAPKSQYQRTTSRTKT